jgi:hypothetical protein
LAPRGIDETDSDEKGCGTPPAATAAMALAYPTSAAFLEIRL